MNRPTRVVLPLLALALAACSPDAQTHSAGFIQAEPDGGDVAQLTMLKATGLYLTDNPLEAPPGSLSRADDAVIRRGNVLEARRGNAPDLTLTSPARSLTSYRGYIIGNTVAGTLFRRQDASSEVIYSGSYAPPGGSFRMRFTQAKNNLYLTTSTGVFRMDSPSATPALAGVPGGLEGTGALTGSSGFLPDVSAVAYRFVWGRRDANGNLLLGAPSGRLVVTNTAGASRDVIVTERIPSGVVANTDFLQIYRTETRLTADGDPGEEMAQVAEVFPTAAQVSAGTLSYTDVASVTNGPTAYFAPSQGGIVAAKERPPIAKDMAIFKGHAFYAVKSARQRAQMTLLAVGGTYGLVQGNGVRFDGDGWTEQYNATNAAEDPNAGTFQVYTSGTASQNIENTARSLVRVINAQTGLIVGSGHLYATYASGANDPPGIIIFEARELSEPAFTIATVATYDYWSPAPRRILYLSGYQRTANVATLTTVQAHGLVVGQPVDVVSTSGPLASGMVTVTAVGSTTTFSYAETGANVPATSAAGSVETQAAELSSSDGVQGNTWALSSFEEQEAVPPSNYFAVGGETSTLYRVVPQGDGLWFFTSEGVYRLSGDTEDTFSLRPFDLTVKVLAPDSVVALENRVWALTDQGVVAISDVGVEVMSHLPGRTSIQKPLQELEATFSEAGLSANLATYGFALAYETEHEYRLWLPDSTDDTAAAFAYVFNTQQGAWTKHAVPALHAFILPEENRQYLGAPTAALKRERKALTAADYQDATGAGIPFSVAYTVLTANNPGELKQWREVVWHLESPPPATLGVSLATEVSPTPDTGTLTTDGLTTVRSFVPVDKSTSAMLTVGASHSTAGEKAALLGISVTYNTLSTAVR